MRQPRFAYDVTAAPENPKETGLTETICLSPFSLTDHAVSRHHAPPHIAEEEHCASPPVSPAQPTTEPRQR